LKNTKVITVLIVLLACSLAFGQTSNKCDTIYDYVEQMPKFGNDIPDIIKYMRKEVIPIISNCMETDSTLITNLYIILTINKNGQVTDAEFPRPALTDKCKSKLKSKLLTMTGWQPGKKDGKNVCIRISLPINCIRWND
jgi:hypothetical protein